MPAQPSSACTFNDELFHSGEPRRIMQADESVYLHPAQVRLPGPRPWWWARTTFHTTDVHRGKLALYESWGFPEVWAEVPDAPSPSLPHRRPAGVGGRNGSRVLTNRRVDAHRQRGHQPEDD